MVSISQHLMQLSTMKDFPCWRMEGDATEEYNAAQLFPQYTPGSEGILAGFWDKPVEENTKKTLVTMPKEDFSYEQDGATRNLDVKEYKNIFHDLYFPSAEEGFGIEATKTTGRVTMTPVDLVRALMDPEIWKRLFPSIIVSAEMVTDGHLTAPPVFDEDADNQQIEIRAVIQPLSPLAAVRELLLTRTCIRISQADDTWLVYDLPSKDRPHFPFIRSCFISPFSTATGLSDLVWIEMCQFHSISVHPLLHKLVESGGLFGSARWFWALSRECRRQTNHYHHFMSPNNKKAVNYRLRELALKMVRRFYAGLSTLSSAVPRGRIDADADKRISFTTDYAFWTAARCVLFEAPADKLFHWLSSSTGEMVLQIPSGKNHTSNSVSLHSDTDPDKRVVRESCFDDSGAILVTARVDYSELLNENADVSSAITSVLAFNIHSHCKGSCFLTVTCVQPQQPDSRDAWVKQVTGMIDNTIQDAINAVVVTEDGRDGHLPTLSQ